MTPVRVRQHPKRGDRFSQGEFAIRHTGGAHTSIQEARNALKLSWRYVEAFEAEAAKLYAQPMDTEQVRHFADALLEVDAAGQ